MGAARSDLIDRPGGQMILKLPGSGDLINHLSFSPDGRPRVYRTDFGRLDSLLEVPAQGGKWSG